MNEASIHLYENVLDKFGLISMDEVLRFFILLTLNPIAEFKNVTFVLYSTICTSAEEDDNQRSLKNKK